MFIIANHQTQLIYLLKPDYRKSLYKFIRDYYTTNLFAEAWLQEVFI